MNGYRPAELRRKMCATARAIAETEDRLAGTLERLAVTRPAEAPRLRARAAHAREFADDERRRAATYQLTSGVAQEPGDGGRREIDRQASPG